MLNQTLIVNKNLIPIVTDPVNLNAAQDSEGKSKNQKHFQKNSDEISSDSGTSQNKTNYNTLLTQIQDQILIQNQVLIKQGNLENSKNIEKTSDQKENENIKTSRQISRDINCKTHVNNHDQNTRQQSERINSSNFNLKFKENM